MIRKYIIHFFSQIIWYFIKILKLGFVRDTT